MLAIVFGVGVLGGSAKHLQRGNTWPSEPRCSKRLEEMTLEAVAYASGEQKYTLLLAGLGQCRRGEDFAEHAYLYGAETWRDWIGDPARADALQTLCPGADAATLARSDLAACRFEAVGLDPQAALGFWSTGADPSEEKATLTVVGRTLFWMSLAEGLWKEELAEYIFLGHGYSAWQEGSVPVDLRISRSSMDPWELAILEQTQEELTRCYWQEYVSVIERPVVEMQISFLTEQAEYDFGVEGPAEMLRCMEDIYRRELLPLGNSFQVTLSAR